MPTSGYCASGARAASRLCRACRGGRGDGAWGRWRLPAALCAGGSIVGTGDGRTGVPRIWLATTAVAPVSPCTSGRRVGYGVVAERAGLNCINYVCVWGGGGGGILCLALPALHTGSSGAQGPWSEFKTKPQPAVPIRGYGPAGPLRGQGACLLEGAARTGVSSCASPGGGRETWQAQF